MRIVFAIALIASTIGLGGCFHHNSYAVSEPLPPAPVSHAPLK